MYLFHRNSLNRYMFHVEDVRMNWQTSAKMVVLTGVMTAMSFNASSVTAQSKDLERTLAGVRLNASSRTVLSKFGNPNEIYIGDIGVRIPGTGAQQGGGTGMGMGEDGGMSGGPGMMGGMSGGAGPSMMGGMSGGSGPRMGGGGMMGSSGMMGGMSGGSGPRMGSAGMTGSSGMMGGMAGGGGGKMGAMGGGSGSMGAPAGMSGAPSSMMGGIGRMGGGTKMGDGEMGSIGGGMGGMMGGMGGMMGGMGGDTGGGAIGAFGRTQSAVARQQEVTWVYNRTTKDAKGQTTAISYEFLINPGGSISQIRCLGYHSPIKPTTQTPSISTQKGIRLGSSYVEILRAYGQPDSYEKSGNILVLTYPKKHVQFQLINQKEQAEPTKAAYRVIAMTIATVEG